MAVRNFDGAADLLVCSIGGLASVDGGANTYAALIKVTTTKDQGVMNVHDSAAAQHQGLVLLSVSGDIGYQSGLGGQDIALAVPTATWGVAVVTKASGTSTPRGHWCVLGGANTHTNAAGTVQDYGANDLAGGSVRFGGGGFGDYDGRIAAAGILNSALSDVNIESLKTSWANWVALFTGSGAALFRFDQAVTTDPVNDQTGNGANQTSLTGTTVVTGDDPPGFDWGAADASWQPNPLSVVRYKIPALRGLRGGDAVAVVAGPVVVGQAVETETAQAAQPLKTSTAQQAIETETAQPIGRVKTILVGQAVETETAQPATRSKTRTVGQALETETGQAVGHRKTAVAGQAVEVESGQPITRTGQTIIQVGQAIEAETALAVGRVKLHAVGQAAEAEAAQTLARLKTRTVGQALEAEVAQLLTVVGGTPAPRWIEHAGGGRALVDAASTSVGLVDQAGAGTTSMEAAGAATGQTDAAGAGTKIIEGSGGV